MFGFGGLSELMFIFFLAMLIFGPEKLPEIGRMLAKGMAEVRKASNELKRTLNAELAISEQELEARRRAAAPPPPMALAPPIPAAAPAVPWVPEAGPAPVASEAAYTPPATIPQADQESQPPQPPSLPPTMAETPPPAEPRSAEPTSAEPIVTGGDEHAPAHGVPARVAPVHGVPAGAVEAAAAAEASTQVFSEGSGPFDHETPAGHEMRDDRSGIVPEPIDDRSDIVPEPR
jgi:sec-independent protein translocase protein TatA